MYPFKLRIKDPELIKVFQQLERQRIVPVVTPDISRKIAWKLKPIRPDIFIGNDSHNRRSAIGVLPSVKVETKFREPDSKVLDIIFKKIF